MTSATSRDPAPAAVARARKPRYAVEVRRIERLSPRMVRVTFGGEELGGFLWSGPASHVKLLFAPEARPDATEAARATTRTYTPRRFDREARELDVEFVIHGEGPASAWAAQAAVGQRLTVAGPGRAYELDSAADWYLLAGDDSAIPAVCTLLEALPGAARKLVLLEVVDAAEERPLGVAAPSCEVTWLVRGTDPASAGRTLEAAVRAVPLPAGLGRMYIACEADAMRRIRRHLLTERQFPRERLVTRGYWRLGETDHPDRDYGEDIA